MTAHAASTLALLLLALSPPPAAPARAAGRAPTVSAELVVFKPAVATFRGQVLGIGPEARVENSIRRIEELLARPGAHVVGHRPTDLGTAVTIDGSLAFVLVPDDADPLQEETLDAMVATSTAALRQVVDETRESRDVRALLVSGLVALAATAVLALLLWGLRRARLAAIRRLEAIAEAHAGKLQVGGAEIVGRERLVGLTRWLASVVGWGVALLLVYEWAGFVLGRFPYTRPWGEGLIRFLAGLAGTVASAVFGAIPGLLLAVVVFLAARFANQALQSFFDRVERGALRFSWLDAETVRPTRRIAAAAIWLFALAMAYPYLPGAQTEAFKGLSVLVGLMISLGASSLVGQAASGLILTYTRTLRVGEYVQIGEQEGTVVETGMFVTRIRTGLGEEVTLSNSAVVNATTKNYSRAVDGPGFVLDTVVTIGYDAPWRQVEAMLLEAARRTDAVVQQPRPRVHQTGLADFYVVYRLVCYAMPRQPVPRSLALSQLHANIQDVFNEHGVQIMSPHYRGDPETPKVVPRSGWFAPPARPPPDGEDPGSR